MFSLNYIIKEIFTEKTRLILTILAIAWGVVSITCMLAVGEGLRTTFSRAMAGVGHSILVVEGGETAKSYHGQSINQQVTLTPFDLQTLRKNLKDATVTPEYSIFAKMNYQHKEINSEVNAVEPIYSVLRDVTAKNGGRFINQFDMQNANRVVVIGASRATQLFGKANPVGKIVTIAQQPFRVIGVAEDKLQMVMYQTPDRYLSWIPASTYIALANPMSIGNFLVAPKNPQQMPQIKQQIIQLIALNHGYDPNDKSIINFLDIQKIQNKSSHIFVGMEIFLGIVGALTLIVAGIGIANVMFVSVRRATREIGIRMAVGARTYHILLHYIIEALITMAIGGVIGFFIAKLIISGIDAIPMHAKFFQFIGKPLPILSIQVALMVIGSLGLVGFFAGLFPAKRAASIDPAEALRHE